MFCGVLRLLLVLSTIQAPYAEPCRQSRDLWAQGKRQEAIQMARLALEDAPTDAELRLCLAEFQVGVHRYEEVLQTLEPLPAEKGQYWRAKAHWMLGHYELALPLLNAKDSEQALLRVQGYLRLGREEEADRELDQRLQSGEGPLPFPWRVLVAQRSLRRGDLPTALAEFEQLHQQDPFDPEVLFGWGRAQVRSGQRDSGLQLLERHRRLVPLFDELEFALRGVDLEPRHPPGHARVGDIERAIGRFDRAEARYRRALQLALEQQAELAPISLRLARLLAEDRQQLEAACQVLADSLKNTSDARLWVRLGDYRLAAGQAERAIRAFEQAQTLRPQDRAIEDRLRAARER